MTPSTPPQATLARMLRHDNSTMLGKLLVVATLMFGFGYALVPIYKAACEAMGINVLTLAERDGKRQNVDEVRKNSQVDTSRWVTVEFDANARGPWQFKPAQGSVQVHPGAVTTVMYDFQNVQGRAMRAQAIASYAPMSAGAHFNKLECFCFNEYTLQPGEARHWPVTFVIDPKLPRDVTTITLSYTFFEVGGKVPAAPQARADQTAPQTAAPRS
jgi:cytochrome c oxidase assembly protein subunit 11